MRKSSTVGTSIYSANLHGEFNEEKTNMNFSSLCKIRPANPDVVLNTEYIESMTLFYHI